MNSIRVSTVVVILVVAWLAGGCGGIPYHGTGQAYYTATNLHPDEAHRRMYSVNYQREGLIRQCTPVTILGVNDEAARIRDESTGVVYAYVFHHRSLLTSIPDHLDKYFAPKCDTEKVSSLSETDKQGIEQGKVLVGMTKQGVLIAIGYPPEHETPNLEMDTWKYWITRVATFNVIFKDGIVSEISK